MARKTMDPDALGGPRESRERAAELAYEAELREWDVQQTLDSLVLPANEMTERLLRYADEEKNEAEALIRASSKNWALDRMPVMDLVLMRLAVAELLRSNTPTGVVISETLLLVGRYSTDESTRFVNGVLGAVARKVRGEETR